MPEPSRASRLLTRVATGEPAAAEELMPLVYEQLRAVARGFLGGRADRATLQPTALVNEAYLKLVGREHAGWEDRAHFAAVAARAMRDILVDHARRRAPHKRGGEWNRVTLQGLAARDGAAQLDLLALDDALARLAALDAAQARLVELRFFAGLTVREIAAVLDQSRSTVMRRLTLAQAWLLREIDCSGGRTA